MQAPQHQHRMEARLQIADEYDAIDLPTTVRLSHRLGETVPGAQYHMPTEEPSSWRTQGHALSQWLAHGLSHLTLLQAYAPTQRPH
jgi:hypothetical protein